VIIPGMTHPTMALSQLSATGVSLASLSVSVASTGFQFLRKDSVDIETCLAIAIPSILSARFGTRLAKRLSGDALSLIFNGISVFLIPAHFWIQHRAQNRQLDDDNHQQQQEPLSTESTDDSSSNEIRVSSHLDYTKLLQHAAYGVFSGLLGALSKSVDIHWPF
jgi:uncharacterized membrane protein YfcA